MNDRLLNLLNHYHSLTDNLSNKYIEDGYEVLEIKDQKDKVNLKILLWENMLNIYMGREYIHILDDYFVENQEQFEEAQSLLEIILYSDIEESLLYDKKGSLRKFLYIFSMKNKKITGKRNGYIFPVIELLKKEEHYKAILKNNVK